MRKARTATLVSLLFAALLLALPTEDALAVSFGSFAPIDFPGAVSGTLVTGVSGGNIVGYSGGGQGFLYNGSTYTNLSYPNAASTYPRSIDGNNIVGDYKTVTTTIIQGKGHKTTTVTVTLDHGFRYDGSTYTTLDDPLGAKINGNMQVAYDIDGTNVVGTYTDSAGLSHGYLYNGSAYTTLDNPLGIKGNIAHAISGSNIVGTYTDSAALFHGYLYNGSTYTTLNAPLGINGTSARGIEGTNIVGDYLDSAGLRHGYLYDGSSFTTLDNPLGIKGTYATDISGSTVVGFYYDSANLTHGFSVPFSAAPLASFAVATVVPEPSTWVLLGIGAISLAAAAVRRRMRK